MAEQNTDCRNVSILKTSKFRVGFRGDSGPPINSKFHFFSREVFENLEYRFYPKYSLPLLFTVFSKPILLLMNVCKNAV